LNPGIAGHWLGAPSCSFVTFVDKRTWTNVFLKEAKMSALLPEGKQPVPPDRRRSHSSAWIGGLVLIAIGVILLLQNLNLFVEPFNWWALFILIPAVAAFAEAWRHYQEAGRLTRKATGSLIGGLLLLSIAVVFLFNLDWGLFWPLILIVIGIGALLDATTR